MNNKKVLLTGVTGFLGSHAAIQLLNKGYEVRGTLRDKGRIDAIREVIAAHTGQINKLEFAVAELSDGGAWKELTQGIDFIQHTASPFPRELPRDENDLILPAKNGTLNILEAAAANQVKRIVMTSSLSAIAYGRANREDGKVFNENDWTDVNSKKDITPYYKSKTIAEKAAWDFIRNSETDLELVTVCPGAILGPVIEQDFGNSANIVVSLLNGSFPALPKIGFDLVDVRSVADLLIKAMEIPEAAGNRYIAASGYLSLKEVAGILKAHFPERKIPSAELPDFVTRILALFRPELKPVLLEMVRRKIDVNKAVRTLNWKPLDVKEAVIACAESILAHKIVK
ncbi:SDR family oxidoreductase [Pedobacter miscanthi]|uniref:Aldehyde reductase n=1 Tax=Pedobacter miscanthi TaxID=2259170 RepID=A0A366LCB5_9SPHI|nr:aldehyde reductase [Pedobacter miscanthi]RBQ11535.1 aldehyde reductase [Pedobacter miscanthi]